MAAYDHRRLPPPPPGYLWFEEQFKQHHQKILRLMMLFGLAVPVPSPDKAKEMLLVPSLIGMNAASGVADDDIDDAERHMVECVITFEQGGDAPSDPLLCDFEEVTGGGHATCPGCICKRLMVAKCPDCIWTTMDASDAALLHL